MINCPECNNSISVKLILIPAKDKVICCPDCNTKLQVGSVVGLRYQFLLCIISAALGMLVARNYESAVYWVILSVWFIFVIYFQFKSATIKVIHS